MGALQHQVKRRKLNPKTESTRQLSVFETLPVEILEEIFLESKNVRLLHVSETMRQRLSSEYVRKEIIFRCFRDPELHEDESLYTELLPLSNSPKPEPHPSDCLPFQDTTHGCEVSLRELVFLLEEEWVTMDLLRSVIVDWMWQVSSTELTRFLHEFNFPSSEFKDASVALRTRIEKATTNMLTDEISYFEQMDFWPVGASAFAVSDVVRKMISKCKWTFVWPPTTAAPVLSISFLENAAERKTSLGYVHVTVARPSSTGVWRPFKTFEKHFVTWRGSNRMIPARLLQGPWTQDRGDLLKFLLDQCDDCENLLIERDLCDRQLKAASAGLMRALRENNPLATYTLLGRCTAGSRKVGQYFINENAFASDNPTPRLHATPQRADAWKRFSWSQEAFPCMRVDLTTSHLAEVIDNFDHHRAVSIQALGHLAHSATKVPELPAGFMAKLKSLAERDWDRSEEFMALIAEALGQLYKELVAKGIGCMGVGLTGVESARTTGASVSLYVSHANVRQTKSLEFGMGFGI